jgi:hypothetical protein
LCLNPDDYRATRQKAGGDAGESFLRRRFAAHRARSGRTAEFNPSTSAMKPRWVMSSKSVSERPVRVGIFDTLPDADRAVDGLLQAGFTKEQLSVVCSDEAVRRHFQSLHHQDPAGSHTPAAAATGAAIGAALGGLAAIGFGVAVAVGGGVLLAAGGLALTAGGVVGSLVGAMMTRGIEKEAANYYDQAVTEGRILVAVEAHGSDVEGSLAKAETILAGAGARPLPLPEG